VAASTRFEARSSIAFDPQNRLWVAYEVAGERWGKDTGPYARKGGGTSVRYRDHDVRVKCFQGDQAFVTSSKLESVLPKPEPSRGRQEPKLAKGKVEAADEGFRPGSFNSFPRLAAGPDGMVYLAFRTRVVPGRTDFGQVWISQAVYFDGTKWTGPVTIAHADLWGDDRAALAAIGGGDLLVATASDHRQEVQLQAKGPKKMDNLALQNFINSDIFAGELTVPAGSGGAQLKRIPAETVAAPDARVNSERNQIAAMQKYRATIGADQAEVLRGEFHSHTELSVDGWTDGPLIDA